MARRDDKVFEAPPVPPGLSPDTVYLGEMTAWSTRLILRSIREEDRGSGVGGWAASRLGKLPHAVQTGLVLTAFALGVQLIGAAYEGITGRPPPQPTQPTMITIPSASADDALTPKD